MKGIEKRLNELAKQIIPISEEFRMKDGPIDLTYSVENIQIIPNNTEAFSLNVPRAARLVELKHGEDRLKHDSIIRILLPYNKAVKFSEDKNGYDKLHEWFTINRYEFLKPLQALYGSLRNVEIVYERHPHSNNREFFRSLENAAALEFRVYCKYKGVT